MTLQREMMALDAMIAQAPSWAALEKAFRPAEIAENFDPGADLKKFLAAFHRTAEGRKLLEWLCDLTFRAPYPHVGGTRDSAWLAAKAHEARAAVGLAICRAVADGEILLNNKGS